MRKATWLLALAVVASLPAVSLAITITNTTTNTVVFYDNFESPSSVSTTPAPDAAYHNPIAITGSYSFFEDAPALVVTNSTTSPDPGPFEGQNYMRIYRDGGAYNSQEFKAIATGPQSTAGHLIRISMMVNAGSDSGNPLFAIMDQSGAFMGYVLAGVVNPGFVSVFNGAWQNTGIPYTAGAWQRWDIDYEVGSSGVSVTVAGNNASAGIFGSGQFGGIGFWNANGAAGSAYVDAIPPVPEPQTMILLACSAAGLVVASRRYRTQRHIAGDNV